MEKRIISIDIGPDVQDEFSKDAGVMWEHNATELQFKIDSTYIGDYCYYIEYRSILGTKVRTEYLEADPNTNIVKYDIPVTMSSLKGVECYFNIVKIDDDGNTVQIIKPKKFCLSFDFSPDTDNSLAKVNDFSINALLEAIRQGTFKGDKGDKGERGETGPKGEQGDGVNNLFVQSANLYNEQANMSDVVIDGTTGELKATNGYYTTDYIFVKAGKYVATNESDRACFNIVARYTLMKDFIPGSRIYFTTGVLEVNEDCYVRFCGLKTRMPKETIMFVKGEVLPSEYVPYYVKLKHVNMPDISREMIADGVISKGKTDFVKTSANLINHMTILEGYVISVEGVLTESIEYSVTDRLILKPSTEYVCQHVLRISYFNKNDEHIKSISFDPAKENVFTTLGEFDYAIASVPEAPVYKRRWQLNEGSELLPYEKQHLVIDGFRIKDDFDVEIDPIPEFRNKDRIVFDKAPLFTLEDDVEGIDVATQRNSSSVFAMYDALMSENQLYIKKTELGADSQGNMLYRYDFNEPEILHGSAVLFSTQKPKVILISGIHNEYAGIYSLFNTMKQITTNPKLSDLRQNIHFIIVPVVNLYGVNNNQRKNENGVDLARNFEVDFVVKETSDVDYGGTEPLTENACQYIDALMRENSDAILFNSCHNFAIRSTNEPKSFMWGCSATKYFNNLANKVIRKLTKEWSDKYDFITTSNGYISGNGSNNYLGSADVSAPNGNEGKQAMKYGIHGGSFEVCDYFHYKSSTEVDSSFVLSRGTETYINLILAHVYNHDSNF